MSSDNSHRRRRQKFSGRNNRQHTNANGGRRGLSLLAAGAAVTTGAGLLASPLCSSPTAVEAASTTPKRISASPRRGSRRHRAGATAAAGGRRRLFHEHRLQMEEYERTKSKEKMAPVAPLDSRIPQNDGDGTIKHLDRRNLGVPEPLSPNEGQSSSNANNNNLHHKLKEPTTAQSDRSPHSPNPSTHPHHNQQKMVGTNSGFPDSHALNSPKPMTVSLRLSLPSVGQSKGETTQEDILEEQAATIQRIQALLADNETDGIFESGAVPRTSTGSPASTRIQILGQTQLVLNSIFLRFPQGISSEQLHLISTQVDGIKRISPMGHYQVSMLETESHVGAKIAQNLYGYDGTGVRVAVLDTGVDYTHKNLGGPGTVEAYIEAMGVDPYDERNKKRDNLFPTVKVVDGYDFVGELSAGEDDDEYIEFDDDPIDAGGHGTSVADTIAGMNGIAPGADIIALKVCAGQGGCPGLSIAMGIEWAVKNSVDILNLSLGSDYGQAFDDELAYAIDSATNFGVLTIASAANCGDSPYCTGTPGSARSAMSVAQTTVPGEFLPFVKVDDDLFEAAHFPWSGSVDDEHPYFTGSIQYGDGALQNTNGCEPFEEGSLEGKVVLVDRGSCFFSDKVLNAENAGAVATLVANNVEGAPFPGGFGGGSLYPIIPALMVSLADGDAIREVIMLNMVGGDDSTNPAATIDVQNFRPTALMTMSSSARGPDMSFNRIKPEIAAPGGNLVAEFGTGDGEAIFGGTSGAAPVVAGAAALAKQACPECSPLALKAFLMNSAYRGIISDTTDEQAEISRVGAGELRASNALASTFIAYSPDEEAPSFSLGLLEVTKDITIRRRMRLVNLLQEEQTVSIHPNFRLPSSNDKMTIDVYETGTDNLIPDNQVVLGTCGDTFVDLAFKIHASQIEANHMNSGSEGDSSEALGKNEIDGYILISDATDEANIIGVPFHALARKSANVVPARTTLSSAYPDTIDVVNEGVGTAQIDIFDLVALSDNVPEGKRGAETPTPDIRAVGVRTMLATSQECEGGFALEFAINSWERQAHLLPVTYYVFLDTDGDGNLDYAVWNGVSEEKTEMQTIATNLATYERSAKYYTEHATNTANTVLRVCGDQIGMSIEEDILGGKRQEITVEVEAYDYLYGGPGDILASFSIVPFGERHTNNPGIESPAIWPLREPLRDAHEDIRGNGSSKLDIYDMLNSGIGESNENINKQSYGALVFTNGNRGKGARGAATFETEALLLLAPGVEPPQRVSSDANANGITTDSVLQEGPILDPNRKPADLVTGEGIVCRAARLTAAPSTSPTMSPSMSPTKSQKPSIAPTASPTPAPSTPWPTFTPTEEPTIPIGEDGFVDIAPTADHPTTALFMPTAVPTYAPP